MCDRGGVGAGRRGGPGGGRGDGRAACEGASACLGVPRGASGCLRPRAAPSAAVGVAPVGLAAMKLSREVGQARPAF